MLGEVFAPNKISFIMLIQFLSFAIFLLICSGKTFASDLHNLTDGCLYGSITVGAQATPVAPCPNADPLNIRNNADVLKIMKALGINRNKVRFKGCSNLRFSAAMDSTLSVTNRRYLITYPIEANNSYISPITHELVHVLQMEIYGGLIPLRSSIKSSKRIELGADYISGIVFSKFLRHLDFYDFMDNLSLIGLYVENAAEAHGTPPQRVAAFRSGFYETLEQDIKDANNYFQDQVYGLIILNERN